MKKLLYILLAMVMTCIAIPTLAAEITSGEDAGLIITERFVKLSEAKAGISINNKTATCTGLAKAQDSSFKINITMRLQQKSGTSWNTISTWTGTGSGLTGARLNKTKNSLSSGTYRTSLYVSVFDCNNKFVESTTVNSASSIVK